MLSKRRQKQAALRVNPQLQTKMRGKTVDKVETEDDGTTVLITVTDGNVIKFTSTTRITVA